jgi:hypothetical protein
MEKKLQAKKEKVTISLFAKVEEELSIIIKVKNVQFMAIAKLMAKLTIKLLNN